MKEFFDMGGYGFYVWWSYGIAAAVLLLNVWLPLRRLKRLLRAADGRRRRFL